MLTLWAWQQTQAAGDRALDALLSLAVRTIPLPPAVVNRRVILVGDALARAWRPQLAFPRIQTLAIDGFDKTPLVRRAIASRPDAIIIQPGAAHFPSARQQGQQQLVTGWTARIQRAAIRPILSTVVPVTAAHARRAPGRIEGLLAFNDWLRGLAQSQQIPLLDLEEALRVSTVDRHLDPGLAGSDGLHLPWRTFRQHLDPLIPPLLLRAFANPR